MPAVSPSDALAALTWRYAVKKFDPAKKIPAETWAALEQSLLLSPSSYGLQPWKFFVVETPAVREQLLPHSWGQRQIVDADKLVVFAVKREVTPADADRLIAHTVAVRGVPAEKLEGYRQMMAGSLTRTPAPEIDVWMSRQVFIALGVFLTTAAMLGVDACPMEGFVPEKYDEVLGLGAKGYASRVVATAGYRAADDAYGGAKKVRYELGEVVEHI
jgi:nitroreductase